jgi:hypothetical protein
MAVRCNVQIYGVDRDDEQNHEEQAEVVRDALSMGGHGYTVVQVRVTVLVYLDVVHDALVAESFFHQEDGGGFTVRVAEDVDVDAVLIVVGRDHALEFVE